MKLSVPRLLPGTDYTIQVRSKVGEEVSEWSPKFDFTTIEDSVLPKTPTNVTWVAMDKHFKGEWDKVNKQLDEDFAKVVRYDVELEKPDGTLREVIPHPASDEPRQSFKLGEQKMQAIFGEILTSVKFRVRAVTQNENKSAWSAPITATIGAPGAPTGLVITPGPLTLKLDWTPPADMTNVEGYRVYVGTTAGFVPVSPVWVGGAASYTYNALNFNVHHFKVCSYSRHNRESTYLTGSGTPGSLIDSDPPAQPSSITGSITNSADNKTASATVNWTLVSPPADLGGFNIRFRKVGQTYWDMASTDAAARTVTFEVTPFVNYEVSLQSLDENANGSAWTTPLTINGVANTPPPTVTGLTSTPQRESITYSWTASTATDVANQAGHYQLQVSTVNTFTAGTTTTFISGFPTYDVAGLSPNTTYYARVRAVDSGGMASAAWSTIDTETTQSFPLTPLSDGQAPASSPTPTVIGGLGYITALWPAITNNDPVTYEVHLGTGSAAFAVSAATKVGEIGGTMTVIRNLPGTTTPLAYGTNYYVRIVAKDVDNPAAAGTGSTAVQILKSTIGDITLTPGDIGAPTTAQAQGYANTAQTNAISAAATDAQTKATAAETAAKSYTDNRETAITTAYNAAITTSANGKNKITHSLSTASGANTAGDTWFQYNAQDQVIGQWRGMGGSTWVSETVASQVIANLDVAKLTTGTIASAVITINTTGQIKSQDYVSGSAGWSLSNGGLQINNGVVDAKVMKSGTSFTNNLFVASTIQVGNATTTGFIQSYGYSAGVQGFSLSKTGLVIEGTGNAIAAAAINVGKVQASQIETSQLTITQSQVANLTTDLGAKVNSAGAVTAIQNVWGFPTASTFIDGGNIYTNTVRASSILVSDFTNYVLDPNFTLGANSFIPALGTIYDSTDAVNVPPRTNIPSGKIAKINATFDAFSQNPNVPGFAVQPGDKFYLEAWVAHTGANTAPLQLRVWTATGNTYSTGGWEYGAGVTVTAASAQDTWIKVSGTYTVPNLTSNAGTAGVPKWGWAGIGVGNQTGWFITRWNVKRMLAGELVVDGSIAANKITAGEYTGGAFIIGAGGSLRTFNSEVEITSSGITVTGANSSIVADAISGGDITAGKTLNVKGTMKVATSGWIESDNFASSGGSQGYRLTSSSLTIKDGSISAKTLTSGDIGGGAALNITGSSYINVASGFIRGNGYTGTTAASNPSGVGWYLGSDGLVLPINSTISAGNITSGNISSATIQITGSGSIYGSGWSLGSGGLEVSSATGTTSITGAAIKTGAIQSQGPQSYIAGPSGRGWSINTDGSVEFNTGTFRGAIYASSGTFAGQLMSATGTFTGTLSGGEVNTGPVGTVRAVMKDYGAIGTGIQFKDTTDANIGAIFASTGAFGDRGVRIYGSDSTKSVFFGDTRMEVKGGIDVTGAAQFRNAIQMNGTNINGVGTIQSAGSMTLSVSNGNIHINGSTNYGGRIGNDAANSYVIFKGTSVILANSSWNQTTETGTPANYVPVYAKRYYSETNTTVTAVSDRKYKTDIQPIVRATDTISKIDMREYNLKTELAEGVNTRRVGVIAQELQKVLPDAVERNETLGGLTVDYTPIYNLNVQATKELIERVERLERELAELRA